MDHYSYDRYDKINKEETMFRFNYHTHTYRCKHASGTDEEYVLAAIEAGYKILGFSDHAPYRDFPSDRSHMDIEQLDEYIASIDALKEKYRDQIEIHVGLETEYFPWNHEERVEIGKKVEYLLLGQHYSDPVGNEVNYFKINTDEEILQYGRSVCEALDTGKFKYLCQPDVVMNRQEAFTPACGEVAHMIGKKASELDIPVEVNVRGVAKGRKPFGDKEYYFYPHRLFWEIMAQYPLRCIVGIDAHRPEDLLETELVDEALDELSGLDLKFIDEPIM